MRIAFLCFEAFHRGGIKTYSRELLNRIVAAGHEVVLFSPRPPPGPSPGLDPAIRVQPVGAAGLRMTSAFTYWVNMPRVFRRTRERTGRFDVVHSNVYADFFLSRRAAPELRVVTVYHLGSTAAAAAGLRFSSRLMRFSSEYGPAVVAEGVCLKRADHIIAISNFTRNDVLRRYPEISPEQVSVIYPGATLESSRPSPEEKSRLLRTWGIERGDRIALAVGRLEDRKGIPFLLEAISDVQSSWGLKLVLVGGGRPDVYGPIARQLGIADRVVFAGYVDDSTLTAAYYVADVFVHAASMEGFGLSVADAVAIGLPVVATRVGSIPEVVVDGVDGYLVGQGDRRAFTDRIEKALRRAGLPRCDDGGRKGARFSWERTANETLSLFERLSPMRNDRNGQ